MKHLFISLLGSVLMVSCSCSDEGASKEDILLRAKMDAEQLSKDAPQLNRIQLERRILEVKNVEAKYRKDGHDKAADSYIEVFQSHLQEIDDSLANAIFLP